MAEEPTFAVMPKASFLTMMDKCADAQLKMDAQRSKIGGLISDATEHHNYHTGAGGWTRRLKRLTPAKRQEWLYQWDWYRDYMGWNQEAADLFREPVKGHKPQLVVEAPAEDQQRA